jgi:hypothetical protein
MCNCLDDHGQRFAYGALKVSKTEKNPGREFYSCILSKANGGCGFFAFADEIYTDDKTGLARKKYVKREPAVTGNAASGETQQRIEVLEQTIRELKERVQKLEEYIVAVPPPAENELPPTKSQKTTGASTRGKTRAKILP